MANLAIKGHKHRGKEVIQTLEMLGGKNELQHKGSENNKLYIIKNGEIHLNFTTFAYCFNVFTIEEFIEKFPYKVGDRVKKANDNDGYCATVISMDWDSGMNEVIYTIIFDDHIGSTLECLSVNLQPYKEETMEEIKIDIPKGYEFAGVDNQQVVFTKIPPKYPKTYEECIDQLPINWDLEVKGHKSDLLYNFQKLLIARDVYWKIAGEQMGLGKPWEPDYRYRDEYYSIYYNGFSIIQCNSFEAHTFIFPTEEMRDAFLENFKDLIERCKELL